jgi:hypothetical protein
VKSIENPAAEGNLFLMNNERIPHMGDFKRHMVFYKQENSRKEIPYASVQNPDGCFQAA